MPNIGPTELIIVLVIVLLVFGPKRLPGLGRQLGSGMREFKDSITNKGSSDDDRDEPAAATPEAGEDARREDTRREANAALGRPESEPQVVDGDVIPDRTVR